MWEANLTEACKDELEPLRRDWNLLWWLTNNQPPVSRTGRSYHTATQESSTGFGETTGGDPTEAGQLQFWLLPRASEVGQQTSY